MLSDLMLRLRALLRPNVVEQELDDELHFHIDQQIASHVRHGLPHDEAVRLARLEFGGLDHIREEHRDARGVGAISHLGRDVSHACRQIRQSYSAIRWQTSILTAFGLLALVLAAVGLYGAISYRVTLRTREIGLRMALGAERRTVFREVVGQGVSIALVGVLIGEVLTMMMGRALGAVDPDIRPAGAIVLVSAGLLWIAVAIFAAYMPAARASLVNPLVALRDE